MNQPELPAFPSAGHSGLEAGDAARSAIDELVWSALAYHTPARFVELMHFTRRLPHYSPFNCMLLHIQNPQLKYVARPEQWAAMGRTIKAGARPLVILAPMHPVLFVFDVVDTEGRDLPLAVQQEVENPFAVEGSVTPLTWKRMLRMCQRLSVAVKKEPLKEILAGDVRRTGDNDPRYLIRLNAVHDTSMQFATLAHELGHLFCGHQGRSDGDFWESRTTLEIDGRELEAEAVAYLVSSRLGLLTASKKYLAMYLPPDTALPSFSM